MMKYYINLLCMLMLVSACNQQSQQSAKDEHGHEHEADETNKEEVHLIQKQMDVMGIELGSFQFLNLSTTVKSNGQLEIPPQKKASVSAVMGGRVTSISVLAGDYVRKGQTLCRLEHQDIASLQQEYAETNSQLSYLKQEFERKQSLYQDSISSSKDYQFAKSQYHTAKAKLSGIGARLKMVGLNPSLIAQGQISSSIPVRAPISGYIRKVEVNMGKYVQPEQEIFEILDNDHIHIDLMVYEKDMHKVKKGQKVTFSMSSSPDSVFQGTIFAMGRAFEDEPKAMVVHAEIDNKQGDLLPGMYVDARIVTNAEKVMALPNDAIVSDEGLNYIFVKREIEEKVKKSSHDHEHDHGHDHSHANDHEHSHAEQPENDHSDEYIFDKIEVNLGASDIGFTEVLPAHHLSEDVQIVTKGAFYLLAEMKKGEGGHEHHH